MKLAPLVLAAAVLCFGAPVLAEPEPAAPAGTAIEPEVPPVPRIKVGGPCVYATTEIAGTVTEVAGGVALMAPLEGPVFGIGLQEFLAVDAAPEPGQVYRISKRAITKGTCVPVLYELIGPATDEAPAAPEN